MQAKKLILRGYVRPKRDYFLAVCIDLNLVAQGNTIPEALASLKEAIEGYFEELNASSNFYKETVPRKSPRSFYIQYHFACFLTLCRRLRKNICKSWEVEQYPVNFTGLQLA